MVGHRAFHGLAKMLFSRRTAEPPECAPEKILLLRVDERVGNLLGMQPLIDVIRTRWPGVKLGLMASTRMELVARSLDGLDHLHMLDKRWFLSKPHCWRQAIRQVRSAGYQVAVDASAWHAFSFTHAALTFYSGAPMRVGYQRVGWDGFHNHLVLPGPEEEHELRQRMRLLKPMDPELDLSPPRLRSSLGEAQVHRWRRWIRSHPLNQPLVGFWPGSRKKERRWPLPYYIQLGRQLQQQLDAEIVLLWGPGEESLRDGLGSALRQGVVEAPATDLEELAGLMRNLDILVTNDTGPMHLSVAVGTPTLSIFASGVASRWGHPYQDVCNLALPGEDPAEVALALNAAKSLLG